uniref:Putative secreted protein n=1 Tax=Culex tarsalis TaxID=7177 RepID=A0A1Q3EUN3_CULTA
MAKSSLTLLACLVAVAFLVGVTAQKNRMCPLCSNYSLPTCGTDGVTYVNPCMLDCKAGRMGVTKKHLGPCGCSLEDQLKDKKCIQGPG